MEEIWRDIPGYIGLYEASTYGRIRTKGRGRDYRVNNRGVCRMGLGRNTELKRTQKGLNLWDGITENNMK